MPDAHANFGYSTIATAPSPASSGTSCVVQAGDGAKFPAVPFNATIWPAGAQPLTTNAEIVRVTAISTDTLTIVRTQESTSARTVVVGDQIANTITNKVFTDIEDFSPNNWITTTDKTVPSPTQLLYESVLEVGSNAVEIAGADGLISVNEPFQAQDAYVNKMAPLADESIPGGSEVIFSDSYELANGYATELATGGLMTLGTSPALSLPCAQVALQNNVTNPPDPIQWDWVVFDSHGFFGANASRARLTIPPGLDGIYLVGLGNDYSGIAAAATTLQINASNKNDPTVVGQTSSSTFGSNPLVSMSTIWKMGVGDYFTARCIPASASNILSGNLDCLFWLVKIA